MIVSWTHITAIVCATLFATMAAITAANDKTQPRRELSLWCLSMSGLVLAPFYNAVPASAPGFAGILLAYTLANAVVVTTAALLLRVFENTSAWSPAFIAVAVITLGLDTFDYSQSLFQNWPNSLSLILVFEYLPQILKVGFMGICLWALLKSWRVDLINRRYHLRYAVVFITLLIGTEMLLVENLLAVHLVLPYEPQAFHSIWQLTLATALSFALLKPTNVITTWLSQPATQNPNAHASTISMDAKRLQHLISDQQVFRDPRLNLDALAKLMDIPVYRLRDLIHKEMGYQNFNVFINDQRIRAACVDLLDSTKQSQSITAIALDSGFGSLAPFNRAFKLITGQTPSQYRHKTTQNNTKLQRR